MCIIVSDINFTVSTFTCTMFNSKIDEIRKKIFDTVNHGVFNGI